MKKAAYKCNTKGCKVNRSAKSIYEQFRTVIKSFRIGKEELSIVSIHLEEQMAVFFKSQIKEAKSLKNRLTEIKRKPGAIEEERFVNGEIDRSLYDKFRSKYEKECFEIKQELNKTGGYKLNLKKGIKNGDFIKFNKIPAWVVPSGEMSNFLVDDFDAILKFMDAELQKEKRKF